MCFDAAGRSEKPEIWGWDTGFQLGCEQRGKVGDGVHMAPRVDFVIFDSLVRMRLMQNFNEDRRDWQQSTFTNTEAQIHPCSQSEPP